jgi:hypothetical protein
VLCTDDRSGVRRYVGDFLKRLKLRQVYPLWASHSPFISSPMETAALLAGIGQS